MKERIQNVSSYIKDIIDIHHKKKIQILNELILIQEIKRKNPYLFLANNVLLSGDVVKSIIDERLSIYEEFAIDDLLKNVALFITSIVYNGRKSKIEGIDIEFDYNNTRYIVLIKTSSTWENNYQVQKMKELFKKAKTLLRKSQTELNIVAVNGCCYGIEKKANKGDYYKYCGQEFWEFISHDSEMYTKLIEPLRIALKEKEEEFWDSYYRLLNQFTLEFSQQFCRDGKIDWTRIVQINSSHSPQE